MLLFLCFVGQRLWEFRERHGQYCNWNLHHQTWRCRSLWATIGCWTDCWMSESSSECWWSHQGLGSSFGSHILLESQLSFRPEVFFWVFPESVAGTWCTKLTHKNCHTKYRFSRTNLLDESVHLDFSFICHIYYNISRKLHILIMFAIDKKQFFLNKLCYLSCLWLFTKIEVRFKIIFTNGLNDLKYQKLSTVAFCDRLACLGK